MPQRKTAPGFRLAGIHEQPLALIDTPEQSAACTTSIRAVTERLHACTEDAPVLVHLAPLRRFYAIPAPNTNPLTDLLTYLLTYYHHYHYYYY